VEQVKGKNQGYYIEERDFELPELKLLVDAVQSSNFITNQKSEKLIHKLEKLTSRENARLLQRQVYIYNRAKSENETIFHNVDLIHKAIQENRQIEFQYAEWTPKKVLRLKREGAVYHASPWSLTWNDENYYLVAYDSEDQKIKHYRVDKMLKISLCEGELREGRETFDENQLADYSTKHFNMYGGQLQYVTLEAENRLVGVFIDRFGTDLILSKTDDDHFSFTTKVEVSGQFLGWIIGLGPGVKITGPAPVVAMMREEAKRLANLYLNN
jgi:predicted DNA-binding transcriptional regulator YafY